MRNFLISLWDILGQAGFKLELLKNYEVKCTKMETRKINVFSQSKRKILCIANERDYLGDGTILHKEKLEIGKQYTFARGEMMAYGAMVHLEELPSKYGYQAYLFEELQPYDEQILENKFRKWLEAKLNKGEKDKEEEDKKKGRIYSPEELRYKMEKILQDK